MHYAMHHGMHHGMHHVMHHGTRHVIQAQRAKAGSPMPEAESAAMAAKVQQSFDEEAQPYFATARCLPPPSTRQPQLTLATRTLAIVTAAMLILAVLCPTARFVDPHHPQPQLTMVSLPLTSDFLPLATYLLWLHVLTRLWDDGIIEP